MKAARIQTRTLVVVGAPALFSESDHLAQLTNTSRLFQTFKRKESIWIKLHYNSKGTDYLYN